MKATRRATHRRIRCGSGSGSGSGGGDIASPSMPSPVADAAAMTAPAPATKIKSERRGRVRAAHPYRRSDDTVSARSCDTSMSSSSVLQQQHDDDEVRSTQPLPAGPSPSTVEEPPMQQPSSPQLDASICDDLLPSNAEPLVPIIHSVDASAVYSMAAALIYDQVHHRLPRLCCDRIFHSVKTILPRSMFEWGAPPAKPRANAKAAAAAPAPSALVLPSGTRIPLGTVIRPGCLDEWLGTEWSMREYGKHKPESCPLGEFCIQHRTVTYIATIIVRASAIGDAIKWSTRPAKQKATASKAESASALYEIQISGSIRRHTNLQPEPLSIAREREALAILTKSQRKRVKKPKPPIVCDTV